jgi:hypothetical protein
MEPLKMNAGQLKAESQLPTVEQMGRNIEELILKLAALQAKAARTQSEEAQLAALKASTEKASGELRAYFTTKIFPDIGEGSAAKPSGIQISDDAAPRLLQDTLGKLGSRAVGIRLLLGEQPGRWVRITRSQSDRRNPI